MTTTVEAILAHHGVKGMKWGVRRAQKRAEKADAKWQKNIYTIHGAVAIHNHVADQMNNGGLDRLNSKPEYKKASRLLNESGEPVGAVGKAYLKDYEKLQLDAYKKAVTEVHGKSPSGKFEARFDTSDKNNWKVVVSPTNVQHDDAALPELTIEIDHDQAGRIVLAKKVKSEIAQSNDLTNDFLAHHGIKGMKWGVRRSIPQRAPKHERGRSGRTTFKKPPKNLSESELNRRIKRLELEKKYTELNAPVVFSGKKYTQSLLENSGKTAAGAVVGGAVSFAVQRALKKHFGGG